MTSIQSVQTSYYNPYGDAPSTGNNGGTGASSTVPTQGGFSTDFSSISSMVAHAGGGGFASYKLSGKMGESIKTLFGKGTPADGAAASGIGQNLAKGFKGIAINGLKGAGLSALVSAGVSAVANGVGVATGKVESSVAVNNVVKDTIGGALGGLTAVTAGGIGSMLFRGGGVMGTVISVGLGAAGGVAGGMLAKKLTDNF